MCSSRAMLFPQILPVASVPVCQCASCSSLCQEWALCIMVPTRWPEEYVHAALRSEDFSGVSITGCKILLGAECKQIVKTILDVFRLKARAVITTSWQCEDVLAMWDSLAGRHNVRAKLSVWLPSSTIFVLLFTLHWASSYGLPIWFWRMHLRKVLRQLLKLGAVTILKVSPTGRSQVPRASGQFCRLCHKPVATSSNAVAAVGEI